MQWAIDTLDASKLNEAPRTLDLNVGEFVVVRSPQEILATLDEDACLDELSFVPQMLRFCGLRLRVRMRAHKMCDTVHATGGRQMTDAVFLDNAWCDGKAYGGCEMACSIVWKEAWLRREVNGDPPPAPSRPDHRLDALVWNACRRQSSDPAVDEYVFYCQAVKMPAATKPLPWWSARQYVVDYKSGNVPLGTLLARISFVFYSKFVAAGVGLGSPLRWLYNAAQSLRGGVPFPVHAGRAPPGTRTPSVDLGLKAGDLVRVKTADQIMDTVDKRLINRGMGFHTEMVPYCGKVFRIKQRLNKIINEKTGRLITLKNSCLILDGVGCHGRFTDPVSCPRALPPYWREIWLERVEPEQSSVPGSEAMLATSAAPACGAHR